MENIFSNYGIEIVVGMIISVLLFLFIRVIYFSYIKKNHKDSQIIMSFTTVLNFLFILSSLEKTLLK